jgi:hypothetical protein
LDIKNPGAELMLGRSRGHMPDNLQEQLAAKDAEIAQLKERIARLERELFDTQLLLQNESEEPSP